MKIQTVLALALSSTSILVGNLAYADGSDSLETRTSFDHHVAAPTNALEIGVATGYTQGVGPISGASQHVEDVARAGGAVELDAMYRINPMFAVGAYGSFSKYSTGNALSGSADVLGATVGIQAAAHLRAERSVDPWASIGAGWRGLWLSPPTAKNTSLQGLELARLQIGVDYRVSEDVSISPVVGGSLNMFVSEDSPMTTKYTEISDKKVNFMGFAGLAGRFDIGGKR
jgi:hypothetical protein